MFIRVYKRKKTRQSVSMKDFFLLFFHTVMSNEIPLHSGTLTEKLSSPFCSFFFFISQTAKIKNKWQIQMANDKDMKGGKLRKNKKCRTTQVSKVQNTSKRIFLNKIFHLRIHSSTFHRVITKQKHTTYKHTYIVQDTQWNNKVNKNVYHRWWSN